MSRDLNKPIDFSIVYSLLNKKIVDISQEELKDEFLMFDDFFVSKVIPNVKANKPFEFNYPWLGKTSNIHDFNIPEEKMTNKIKRFAVFMDFFDIMGFLNNYDMNHQPQEYTITFDNKKNIVLRKIKKK